jgi:cation transporter-like permease
LLLTHGPASVAIAAAVCVAIALVVLLFSAGAEVFSSRERPLTEPDAATAPVAATLK